MADILRLKKWSTYLSDGRSYSSNSCADKKEVAVAVIVGFEPAKIDDEKQFLNVDDVILDMAEHIRGVRKREQSKKKRKAAQP